MSTTCPDPNFVPSMAQIRDAAKQALYRNMKAGGVQSITAGGRSSSYFSPQTLIDVIDEAEQSIAGGVRADVLDVESI